MGRAPCCDKANVKKGAWSPEEDEQLKQYIEKNGTGANWIALPQKAGLRRCGKSCRLRWLNYLRPNLKHGEFSDQEDRIICSLFSSIGSRWSVIAAQLPGRTDNDIKNYWNTKLKKKIMAMAPSTKYRTSTHDNQATDNNLLLQTSSVYECTNLITTPNIAFSRSDQYHHDQPIIPNFTTLISPKFSNENPLSIQPQLDEYMGFMKNGENDIFFGFGGGNNGSCSSSDEQISHGSVDESLCFQSYFSNGVGEIQDQDQEKLLISGSNHDIGYSLAAANDENPMDNYSIEEIKQLISSTNYNVSNNLNFFVDDMMIKIEDNVLDY